MFHHDILSAPNKLVKAYSAYFRRIYKYAPWRSHIQIKSTCHNLLPSHRSQYYGAGSAVRVFGTLIGVQNGRQHFISGAAEIETCSRVSAFTVVLHAVLSTAVLEDGRKKCRQRVQPVISNY